MAKRKLVNFWRPETTSVDVRSAIVDATTTVGMTDQAIAQLRAAASAAKYAGLSRIDVVAARGGGHKSHFAGTEWDIVGYNANGSKWTRDQRVMVAEGARRAGATRFGLYESGATLHFGYGPKGFADNITWGAGNRTSGEASRRFGSPVERAFAASVSARTPYLAYDAIAKSPLTVPAQRAIDLQVASAEALASDLPKGDYGEDRVVIAALSGDTKSLKNAFSTMTDTVMTKEGVFGIGAATKKIEAYFVSLATSLPDTARRVKEILATKPEMWSAVPAGARATFQAGFDAIPDNPIAKALGMPMPRLRPSQVAKAQPATGSRAASEVATGTQKVVAQSTDQTQEVPLSKLSNAIVTGGAIRKGSNGEAVREVQAFLNAAGYTDDQGRVLKVDGDTGPRTKQAIKAYQEAKGLKQDGVIGPRTFKQMAYDTMPMPRLRPGSDGTAQSSSYDNMLRLPGVYASMGATDIYGRANPDDQATIGVDGSEYPATAEAQTTLASLSGVVASGGKLRKGDTGEAVRELQVFLNAQGVTDRKGRALREDGKFGSNTAAAFRSYQDRHPEMLVDGVVGATSLAQMVADQLTASTASPSAGSRAAREMQGYTADDDTRYRAAAVKAGVTGQALEALMETFRSAKEESPGRSSPAAGVRAASEMQGYVQPSTTGMEGSPELASNRARDVSQMTPAERETERKRLQSRLVVIQNEDETAGRSTLASQPSTAITARRQAALADVKARLDDMERENAGAGMSGLRSQPSAETSRAADIRGRLSAMQKEDASTGMSGLRSQPYSTARSDVRQGQRSDQPAGQMLRMAAAAADFMDVPATVDSLRTYGSTLGGALSSSFDATAAAMRAAAKQEKEMNFRKAALAATSAAMVTAGSSGAGAYDYMFYRTSDASHGAATRGEQTSTSTGSKASQQTATTAAQSKEQKTTSVAQAKPSVITTTTGKDQKTTSTSGKGSVS